MRRRIVAVVAAPLLALATAACGGDEPSGGAEPSSDDASDSPSASSSPSEDPSEDLPFPDVEPADGETISLNGISVTAPAGWDTPGELQTRTQVSISDGATSVITLQSTEAIDASDGDVDLWVQRALRGSVAFTDAAEVLVPVEVDGVESYHIYEVTPGQDERHEVGATIDRRERTFVVDVATTYSADEREELVKSMLNTLSYE